MISFLFFLLAVDVAKGYNDYPSLMTANATMAVVIEKSFFNDEKLYENAVSKISDTINGVIRECMQLGGIEITVYADRRVNLGRDFTILFSIARCQRTWALFRVAQKERLAHISITDSDCPRLPDQEGISIPLINPGHELPQLFLDLRASGSLSWKKINILYDNSFKRDSITEVLKAFSIELPKKKVTLASMSLFAIKYEKDYQTMRQQIMKTLSDFQVDQLGNCFMVIVTVDMVNALIEAARSLKMVHPGSQWLFILSDSTKHKTNISAFADKLIEGENVAFIYNATKFHDSCNSGLFCHVKELIKALSLGLEASLQSEIDLYSKVTDEEFEVLRLAKHDRVKEIVRYANEALAEERSTSGGNCGQCLSWRIGSAITWGNSFDSPLAGKGQLIDSGSWSPGPGSNLSESIFPHIDYGFRGKTLPVITYHNPPWQIVQYSTEGVPKYDGLTFDVVQHLSQKLNFTYKVILASSAGLSKPMDNTPRVDTFRKMSNNKNQRASGVGGQKIPEEVIELVKNKKVFFGACAYTVYESRKEVINYTVPISMQTYTFLTPKPKPLSRALLFISPFSNETWACLASAIIIIGPILYLIHKLSPKPTIGIKEAVGLNTPDECVWYIYGALLQQGGMNLPRADSARLIVGTWWLVVMVLVATYSGSLVAFLTFPRMDDSISTIDDLLARSTEFTWSFPNGSFLEEYLQTTEESKYHELLSKAERHNSTDDHNIVLRIREGNHILIDWKSSLKFLMRRDFLESGQCDFSLSSDEFISEPIAMMIGHESPYLTMINKELKRMHETGLIAKWTLERMPMKDECWEGPGNGQEADNHKVNMDDMQGIFFVLAIGFTIAAIIISCEVGWHKKKEAYVRKLIRPFIS